MQHLEGWLFDVYAASQKGVSVWLIDAAGKMHHLQDEVLPYFFVGGTANELHTVCQWLNKTPFPIQLARATRYDVFSRCERLVLQVSVLCANDYVRLVQRVIDTFPKLTLYHADLSIPQFYYFRRNVFPVAKVDVNVDEQGRILEMETQDSPGAVEYELPPLRTMTLSIEGDSTHPQNPCHGYRAPIVVGYEGREYVLDDASPARMLKTLRSHLVRYDPDIILSNYGDAFLFPYLMNCASQHLLDLPLNRESGRQPWYRRARSSFTYGHYLFQPESHLLFGRWHLDRQTACLFGEFGLAGVIEMARLAHRPVQQSARATIGGAVSTAEVATAFKHNYLIPLRKQETEDFETAEELLRVDRGGLVYQPVAGMHYDVFELDFLACFLAIMVQFNISGETVNCSCCRNHVPQLKLRICQKRRGVVPLTIEPVLQKRKRYRRLKREHPDPVQRETYRGRDAADKWWTVACFGFTGHVHAKFGLLSAHAAVCAYARETILRTKEIAEARDFRVLHINVDCVWIQKPGATEPEVNALIPKIEQATGLSLMLEARYRWVAFLNSRVDPRRSVPNRYFAATVSGDTKLRGIEARRHDTPAWIAAIQTQLIEELAQAITPQDIAAKMSAVLQIVTQELDRLRAGHVPLYALTLASSLSRLPHEYKTNNLNAAVARQLQENGVVLHLGERVQYLVLDRQATLDTDRVVPWEFIDGKDGYDVAFYEQLFLRAVENVLAPCGISAAMLRDALTCALPPPTLSKHAQAGTKPYWGPLFVGVT